MTELILNRLSVAVPGRTLLHPTDATIAPGHFVAVVGANGAGKSTLLRAIAALTPTGGTAHFGDAALGTLSPVERARLVGYLPQAHDFAWALPVRDMVALGLYAFGDAHAGGSGAVDAMLAQCGISDLADCPVDRLSGGERALAAFARVLIAEPPLLLLDEPAAALDIGRQYQLLEQLSACAAAGRTVIVVLHDLALVSQFSDRILWIDGGSLVADTPNDPEAIDPHARRLLGRAPSWTATRRAEPATLYFARQKDG